MVHNACHGPQGGPIKEMTTTKTKKTTRRQIVNLNLAASYVPTWGAWEVAREAACNAIDADRTGMNVSYDGEDRVTVTTNTWPSLAQILVMGEGTKRQGGSTIGQFGEGMKLAALVATRSGGKFTIATPEYLVAFQMRNALGTQSLHALVTEGPAAEGCTIDITMAGIGAASRGKILELDPGPTPCRMDAAVTRIYLKGIFVTSMTRLALTDWNFETLAINRDRSMVSDFEVTYEIGRWMDENLTIAMASQILDRPESFEAKALEYWDHSEHIQEQMAAAFILKNGEGAVLATGTEADQVAAREGHRLSYVPDSTIRAALAKTIATSHTITTKRYDLEAVDPARYSGQLMRLRELDPIIAAPNVTVRIFAARSDDLKGMAELSDIVLWLSEALFTEGNDRELVRTYLHEMGHIMSQGSDASMAFEAALEAIAGRLAIRVLGGAL